jgi:hypothetical protein
MEAQRAMPLHGRSPVLSEYSIATKVAGEMAQGQWSPMVDIT